MTSNSLAGAGGCVTLPRMRSAIIPLLLGVLPAFVAFSSACGQSAGVAPDAGNSSGSSGGGSGSGGSSGGSGSSSGGVNEGGPQMGTFTVYSPQGCKYSYAPPSSLMFTNLAYDDNGAVSASMGVPQRVRLGLGGGIDKSAGVAGGYADPTTTAAFTWETAESTTPPR